jgi:hypothetical protein
MPFFVSFAFSSAVQPDIFEDEEIEIIDMKRTDSRSAHGNHTDTDRDGEEARDNAQPKRLTWFWASVMKFQPCISTYNPAFRA